MGIENLGFPHLGATNIPESERTAWPSDFIAPQRIDFHAAESVTNEVYFCRSTAMVRACELLGADVPYMAFHIGVNPNATHYSPFGAGIVLVDDAHGSDDEGKGLYYDFRNGRLIVEHVMDSQAQISVTVNRMTKTISTVHHFHVAAYGKDQADTYAHLDIGELYRKVYEESLGGITGQDMMLGSFGTGIRQYLPTYFHSRRNIVDLPGHNRTANPSGTFTGLRVPAGLPPRRSYQFKDGLPKHHIYYLNSPPSPYYLDKPAWR